MAEYQRNILELRNKRICMRNFKGVERKDRKGRTVNPAGARNFHIILDLDEAQALANEGWNVKFWEPREDGDEPMATLPCHLTYNNYPPIVKLVNGNNIVPLNESQVGLLDSLLIDFVKVSIHGSHWSVNGNEGIKAYVSTLYVHGHDADPFAADYATDDAMIADSNEERPF